jgi:hypothetical protein
MGGAPGEGLGLVDAIDVCESGLEVVATTDVDESTEARAGEGSRRQPPNIARKTSVAILI